MITRKDLLALAFYERSPFTGSEHNMCYKVEKVTMDETSFYQATVWMGPYCFAQSDPTTMTTHQEEYSEEGMCALVDWMNTEYENHYKVD